MGQTDETWTDDPKHPNFPPPCPPHHGQPPR